MQLPYNGPKADIWCLGVAVFCLLYKELPFAPSCRRKLIDMRDHAFLSRTKEEDQDFFHATINFTPNQRWSAKQLLYHSWFNEIRPTHASQI